MDIEELVSILKELKDAKEKFRVMLQNSDLSEEFLDDFESHLSLAAHVVGEVIGKEYVAKTF